mgnify:CR=1 FL=1
MPSIKSEIETNTATFVNNSEYMAKAVSELKSFLTTFDQAALAKGGIDLNPTMIQMNTQKNT